MMEKALHARLSRSQEPAIPLERAHAHNDYWHKRPLMEALENGFCSVEADIHLVNGQLLVAHDLPQTKPDKTLQSLYLDPLRERVLQNKGRVYPNGPEFTLLIDIKSDAADTYRALRDVLKRYEAMLTVVRGKSKRAGAITVILSGNRPRQMSESEPVRYAAFDGRLEDLDKNISPYFMPLVSDDWKSLFKWLGTGTMPEEERRKLRDIVQKAHRQGYKIRFWGAFDFPRLWEEQFDAGVDLINADRLQELRKFLQAKMKR